MISLYPWHKKSWEILIKSLDKRPNAFLFLGSHGIGALNFVLYLSKVLLCENIKDNFNPCNNCSSCLLFESSNHPDFYHIVSDSNSRIKIESIKYLIDKINLSSVRGGLKVVLVIAEKLNISSSNAMLKLLEEPPNDVIFLLISYNIAKVLPTIVSRCRKFKLLEPSCEESLLYLKQNDIKDAKEKLLFNGCKPIFNISDEQIILKDKLFEFLSNPKISNLFEISDILNNGKISLELSINWFLKWIVDVVSFYYTGNIIYNIKFKSDIINIAGSVNILKFFEVYDKLKDTYGFIDYNLNYRLQIENLLIEYLTFYNFK